MGTELTLSTSYQPQTDGQIEIVKKWIEGYLRNYVQAAKSMDQMVVPWEALLQYHLPFIH